MYQPNNEISHTGCQKRICMEEGHENIKYCCIAVYLIQPARHKMRMNNAICRAIKL